MPTSLLHRCRHALILLLAVLLLAALPRPAVAATSGPLTGVVDVVTAKLAELKAEDRLAEARHVRIEQATARAVAAASSAGRDPAPPPQPEVMARVAEVELVLPSQDVLAHGFHEGGHTSRELTPVGSVSANPRGADLPAPSGGPDYVVMASRGRAAPATSAIDVAVLPDTPVLAPVTGTVVAVSPYSLYGRTPDVMLVIAPQGDPSLQVTVMHIEDVEVGPGDTVVAGRTTIAARSRLLPFGSQIDRFSGQRSPHVHLQVDRV